MAWCLIKHRDYFTFNYWLQRLNLKDKSVRMMGILIIRYSHISVLFSMRQELHNKSANALLYIVSRIIMYVDVYRLY
jgi:hypothetical protein